MIQAFVPKSNLVKRLGKPDVESIALATLFGSISSSCSFAALAAARSLVLKGAHFVAAIAFMFASTNLVIELGILILIFLGWQFLLAEIAGGLLLIMLSAILIRLTYPKSWLAKARERVERQTTGEEQDFDWKKRITSLSGWQIVARKFVNDWQMVWKEILIGFTVAGFVAVFVPADWWGHLFLSHTKSDFPSWVITLENALVAPFVAAATFIGSMGNIPLATVLNANGVLFAGIMGFIYSDLIVPPLVAVNAKYYGWRVAMYIAGIMYVSIVATALFLDMLLFVAGITPQTSRRIADVVQFSFDYTFWLNLVFVIGAGALVFLWRRSSGKGKMDHEMEGDGPVKKAVAGLAGLILLSGVVVYFIV